MQYTGREKDTESGLYYYRARYYDPELGRFISEDPIGFDGGINFYAYSGARAQSEITSGIYFFEGGGASYVGQSGNIAIRLANHVENAGKPILSIDDAVRVSVSGGKSSREVAEQFTLNNMGGVGESGVLNLKNPIGAARQGLLSNSNLGNVTSIATPAQSMFSPIASGSTTGAGLNLFGSGSSGGFVIYPSKSNTNMMAQAYSK
jgi:uncharacterized protein RhaS with RHS repeats